LDRKTPQNLLTESWGRFIAKISKSRKQPMRLPAQKRRKMSQEKPVKRPKHKTSIQEVVREATAGGVVYRITRRGSFQVLLFQDARDRWTIPKGHVEKGETAQETAIREIGEEVGLFGIEPVCWLGKVNFRYRRMDTLVLMTMQTYLFRSGKNDQPKKEDWMRSVRWFDFDEAIELVEYDDIGKLMLLAKNRLRQRGEIV
jgi:ADP-ribose pyrophosphatase YjhB (NUDIX family)